MSGFLLKSIVSVIRPPQQQIGAGTSFCIGALDCEYIERVFAGADYRTNDTSSFLYRKIRSADTIAIELHRNCEKIADITDNTLGVYYVSFAAQPLYVAFVIDWGKVFQAHGGGFYRIMANKTILGQLSTQQSRKFYLNSYDDESANETVRLDIVHKGNIIASEFDYTGLLAGGWKQQFRIPATIEKNPSFIKDSYLSSDYTQLNVQPSSEPEYVLKTRLISSEILDIIAEEGVLADSVKMTNYDLLNPRSFTDFEVMPESIEKAGQANRREIYELSFKAKKLNILKTF